jgi:sucrose phosphorylase
VPGLYTHGLFALPNDYELAETSNVRRDINRGVIDSELLSDAFADPDSKRSHLVRMSRKIHLSRTRNRAFHPQGDQLVLMISPDVLIVLRVSPEGDQHILTMTNVTDRASSIEIPLSDLGLKETKWRDLMTEKEWTVEGDRISITMQPYDVIWLMPVSK